MNSSISVLGQAESLIEGAIVESLKCYQNEQFGSLRVVIRDGDPWFVAKDVCDALEIVNTRDATSRLDDDEKGVAKTDTLGGMQEMTIVSEPGLYSLVLRSNKPEAKTFKRWITHDVIPSIRKTGKYSLSLPDFSDPAEAAIAWAKEYREKQAAIAERDRAIRTKYLFVEGRDAEMCGRVGGLQTSKNNLRNENEKLKDAVGRGQNWQTISMMRAEWIREYGHRPNPHKLKEFSKDTMIPPVKDVEEKVILPNGGEKVCKVYRYHKDTWQRYRKYEESLKCA